MTTILWHSTAFAALLGLAGAACGEDNQAAGPAAGGSGAGGNAGAGGTSGAGGSAGSGGSTGDCAATIEPSSDDSAALLGALIEAQSGDTICLKTGTYSFSKEITLIGVDHVTVRGTGATRDDVVLDFANQVEGDNAAEIDADYFTLQDVTLKDAPGDGVKITNSKNPVVRNIRAFWSAGPSPDNGAYALYPAESENVLIEDCEIEGASDAGIYVGQSTNGILRRNKAHGNVIGIETENSINVEIYDNEAWDNTCGILVNNLPNLVRKQNEQIHVHDNHVHDNNRANFAYAGSFVEGVPTGSGIIVLASDHVDMHDNRISGNGGIGVLVVSWPTYSATGGFQTDDSLYEQYSERVYVHSNVYTGNGADPQGVYSLLVGPGNPGFDVGFDGLVDSAEDPATADQRRFCLREATSTTFYDMKAPPAAGSRRSDATGYDCEYPAQDPVRF